MPEYAYQALDRSGASVAGTIQADNPELGAERVRQLGLFPMAVTAAEARAANGRASSKPESGNGKTAAAPATVLPWRRGVARMDVVLFTRQLADLVSAGLPLDRALTVLIRQTQSYGLRERLVRVQEEVRAGRPLSEALGLYPREFPRLYVNMVHAGETAGQLGEVLERLAGYLEREITRRSQVVSALTYPAVLVVVAISAVSFLLTFVVPRLSGVLTELKTALPLPTVILLGFAGFIAKYWPHLLIGIAAAVLMVQRTLASPAGRAAWDAWKLRIPLFGGLLARIVSSRFVRSLGTMLTGGVPILESLEISRDAAGNVAAARSVDRIRESIRQGESLAEAMEGTGFFLPVVVHMTAVGEETGRLPAMLVRTADSLDFEIDSQIRRLVTLIEPLIVVVMGVVVGFIVLSILLPIFEANMAVGK
jgi:type II secretion system protein F